MPFYDENLNRVLVTVKRPEDAQQVYDYLTGQLLGMHVPAPDERGRMWIPFDQAHNTEGARGVRATLDREWSDSAEWIGVEPSGPPPRD